MNALTKAGSLILCLLKPRLELLPGHLQVLDVAPARGDQVSRSKFSVMLHLDKREYRCPVL